MEGKFKKEGIYIHVCIYAYIFIYVYIFIYAYAYMYISSCYAVEANTTWQTNYIVTV